MSNFSKTLFIKSIVWLNSGFKKYPLITIFAFILILMSSYAIYAYSGYQKDKQPQQNKIEPKTQSKQSLSILGTQNLVDNTSLDKAKDTSNEIDEPTFTPTPTSPANSTTPTPTSIPTSLYQLPILEKFDVHDTYTPLQVFSEISCVPDANRKIQAGIWDFGDGTTHVLPLEGSLFTSGTKQMGAGRIYTTSGTYTVTAKCRDDLGNLSSSISKTITVSQNQTYPKIDSLSPSSGHSGQDFTIKGVLLGADTGEVIFCTVSQSANCSYGAPINSWIDTEIKARVPGILTQIGAHQIYVKAKNGKESNKLTFTLTAGQPIIDNITPGGAKPGEQLVITGSNFGSGNGQVNFYKTYPNLNGSGNISSWSNNEVEITIPSNFEANTEYGIQIVSEAGASSSFKYYTLGAN